MQDIETAMLQEKVSLLEDTLKTHLAWISELREIVELHQGILKKQRATLAWEKENQDDKD